MTVRSRVKQGEQQSKWEARQRRNRLIVISLWIAVGLAFAGTLVFLVWQQAQPAPRPGEAVPVQSSDHVQPGLPHDAYNSDPPTSGPHYASATEAGFYEEAPPDEILVHNLEHGHVIIWYSCRQLSTADCTKLKDDIRAAMGSAGVSVITGTAKLVAVPRPSMANEVTLTSWARLDRLDKFDRQEILSYIKAFRDTAPENGAP